MVYESSENEQAYESDERFQALKARHQELDQKVDAAEAGQIHMGHLELSRLKRERLYVKQQMEFIKRRWQIRGE